MRRRWRQVSQLDWATIDKTESWLAGHNVRPEVHMITWMWRTACFVVGIFLSSRPELNCRIYFCIGMPFRPVVLLEAVLSHRLLPNLVLNNTNT